MKATVVLTIWLLTVVLVTSQVLDGDDDGRGPVAICPCPKIWDPLCATDGRTYGNRCMLECQQQNRNANLRVLRAGSCDEDKADDLKDLAM